MIDTWLSPHHSRRNAVSTGWRMVDFINTFLPSILPFARYCPIQSARKKQQPIYRSQSGLQRKHSVLLLKCTVSFAFLYCLLWLMPEKCLYYTVFLLAWLSWERLKKIMINILEIKMLSIIEICNWKFSLRSKKLIWRPCNAHTNKQTKKNPSCTHLSKLATACCVP